MTLSLLSGNGIKELDGFGKPGKKFKPSYSKILQKRNTHVKRLEEDERQWDFLQSMFQKGKSSTLVFKLTCSQNSSSFNLIPFSLWICRFQTH